MSSYSQNITECSVVIAKLMILLERCTTILVQCLSSRNLFPTLLSSERYHLLLSPTKLGTVFHYFLYKALLDWEETINKQNKVQDNTTPSRTAWISTETNTCNCFFLEHYYSFKVNSILQYDIIYILFYFQSFLFQYAFYLDVVNPTLKSFPNKCIWYYFLIYNSNIPTNR